VLARRLFVRRNARARTMTTESIYHGVRALSVSLVAVATVSAGCKGSSPGASSDAAPASSASAAVAAPGGGEAGQTADAGAGARGSLPDAGVCVAALPKVFTRAICSCGTIASSAKLTTDVFDSAAPKLDAGIGAGVAGDEDESFANVTVGGDLVALTNLKVSARSLVRGDLYVGGATQMAAPLKVGGQTYSVAALPAKVTAVGAAHQVPSIPPPCDCSHPVPVTSLVASHRPPANDDATIELSPSAATGTTAAKIELPTGVYYLTGIAPKAALTIAATGNVELYVDGDVAPSGPLTVQLEPDARMDLFVTGSLRTTARFSLGATSRPSQCRAYVAGPELALSSRSTIGCNLYAPAAAVKDSSPVALYGSLFVGSFANTAAVAIHFDKNVRQAAGCCDPRGCED
jgi:hypothetical protein